MNDTPKLDWSLFNSQEKEISTINNELHQLRKQKYPEYRDSYYRYYNEFGMRGMIGDLYRKFDRLKIMSESYSDEDIRSKEKEITDQFYDIISYCQLQLYWLRKEKWGNKEDVYTAKVPKYDNTRDWDNTTSVLSKGIVNKAVIGAVTEATGNVVISENREILHGVAHPPDGFRLTTHVSYLGGRESITKPPRFVVDSNKITIYDAPIGTELKWSVEWEKIEDSQSGPSISDIDEQILQTFWGDSRVGETYFIAPGLYGLFLGDSISWTCEVGLGRARSGLTKLGGR
jgi:hypothetical protein